MSTTLTDAKNRIDSSTGTSDDADDQTGTDAPNAEKGELFNRDQYELEGLQIPKVDGQSIDKIAIKFSGRVMLDRSDPADVAMFNRLQLGQDVELRISAKVSNSGGAGFTTSKEGDLDAVVGSKSLAVDSVWVLEPEQL